MIIVHKCNTCGWSDLNSEPGAQPRDSTGRPLWPRTHSGRDMHGGAGEGCPGGCDWGEPEIMRTWDPLGRLEEQVHPPGYALSLGTVACGCEACQAKHAEVTA